MNSLENNLALFTPISLENINEVELMQRHDTKFLLHKDALQHVLKHLQSQYAILEIHGKRNFRYETMYYDTDDYYFYHQHHNQRLNRYKVRCRKYADSNKCYFEIKFKTNKNKTIKTRRQIQFAEKFHDLSDESKIFAEKHFSQHEKSILQNIRPKIQVDYNRVTLVNQEMKERVTFDTHLTYTDNISSYKLSNLVIAELKQEKISLNSPIVQCFRDLRILPADFSKYCMGVIISDKDVKINRFKKKMIYLQQFI